MSRTQIVIDDKDDGGNTQLMRAALEGHTEAVKDLLSDIPWDSAAQKKST